MNHPHGHWLHFGDPNECPECYSRGQPPSEVDLAIRGDGSEYGEWFRIYVWPNEMHTERLAGEYAYEHFALKGAIEWLVDEGHIPRWHFEPKLLENPFLNGTQKFDIMASCYAAAERVDFWAASLVIPSGISPQPTPKPTRKAEGL